MRPEWDDQFREDDDERSDRLRQSYILRKRAMSYLRLFGPDTYGLEIPRELAQYMEKRGWVTWKPPKFATTLYAITDAGRSALAEHEGAKP